MIKIILIACYFPFSGPTDMFFAQIIDDAKGTTLVSAGDLKFKGKNQKTESAKNVGLNWRKWPNQKRLKRWLLTEEDTNIKVVSRLWRKARRGRFKILKIYGK